MKVALLQLNAGGDKRENIEKAVAFIRRAIRRKAKFILLPEAFNLRKKPDAVNGHRDAAESLPGRSIRPLSALAREYKIFILAGSVAEKIKGSKKVHNTSVLLNDKGRIIAKYRKTHLFKASIGKNDLNESRWLKRGDKGVCVSVGSWKAGLSICYDLRFPSMYRQYCKAGADMICVPAVFTRFTGKAHWEVLLRARAIETLSYVLAANQVGTDGQGVRSHGHSMIVDPWGKIVARADGWSEQIITATLDKNTVRRARRTLPGIKFD